MSNIISKRLFLIQFNEYENFQQHNETRENT